MTAVQFIVQSPEVRYRGSTRQRAGFKENVCCGVTSEKVYGPLFFAEETVRAVNQLDMIEQYVVPQLQQDGMLDTIIYQQVDAPPHWTIIVREQLNHIFNDRWCGRDGPITWPPNSPDLTASDFFVWGYVKFTQKEYRIWLTYEGRVQRPFSKSLQKCCVPHGAIWIRGLICAACAIVDMLSANVL